MAIIYGFAESEKELLKKYSDKIKKIEDADSVYEEMKKDLEAHGNKGLVAKIKKWSKQKQVKGFGIWKAGAEGENMVLEKLSQLSDEYHVLCGVNIATFSMMGKWKTAQIDFVVVSKKGVILIEVKNWSPEYTKDHKGFNPYEQTKRAGYVLWLFLKSWRFNPPVTNVLLSIQTKMPYNKKYKSVFVSDLDRINYFLQNRNEVLSDKDVEKNIKKLKNQVTK